MPKGQSVELSTSSGQLEERFAAHVRLEREYREWSQADLARLVNEQNPGTKFYPSTIGKIENPGGQQPRVLRLSEAAMIATAFGLDLSRMLTASTDLVRVAQMLAAYQTELSSATHTLDRALTELRHALTRRPDLAADGTDPAAAMHLKAIRQALDNIGAADEERAAVAAELRTQLERPTTAKKTSAKAPKKPKGQ